MKSIVFGIGNDYEINKKYIEDEVVVYIDNNNYGKIMPDGKKVIHVSEIVNYDFDRIIITSSKYKTEMIEQLKNINVEYVFKTELITEIDKRSVIKRLLVNNNTIETTKKNERLKKGKYYVVIPAGAVTGGPELLHQLAYFLKNKNNNLEVNIVYYQKNMPYSEKMDNLVPPEYDRYVKKCNIIHQDDIEDESENILIIPEVLSDFGMSIKNARVFFWWLSVDNFINSIDDFSVYNFLKNVDLHMYQSEYARKFIVDLGINEDKIIGLGDYINDDYFVMDSYDKENIIAYNPKKGFNFTLGLRNIINEYEFIPIQNMNRNEVKILLEKSKVYIDFGNHPGKDRLPREAALMNCCVICARRGSAENAIDVPIMDEYKIDTSKKYWWNDAKRTIISCLENYDENKKNFKDYKDEIMKEKDVFKDQIDILLNY